MVTTCRYRILCHSKFRSQYLSFSHDPQNNQRLFLLWLCLMETQRVLKEVGL